MQSAAAPRRRFSLTGTSSPFNGLKVQTNTPPKPKHIHAIDDLSIERLRTIRSHDSSGDSINSPQPSQAQRMERLIASGVFSPVAHSARHANNQPAEEPLTTATKPVTAKTGQHIALHRSSAEQQSPQLSAELSNQPKSAPKPLSLFFRLPLRSMSPKRRARGRQEQPQQQQQQQQNGQRQQQQQLDAPASNESNDRLAIEFDGRESSSDSEEDRVTFDNNTETKVSTLDESIDDNNNNDNNITGPIERHATVTTSTDGEIRGLHNTVDETSLNMGDCKASERMRRTDISRRHSESPAVTHNDRRSSSVSSKQQVGESASASLSGSSRRGSAVLSWISGTPRSLSALARRARRRNSTPPENSMAWVEEKVGRRRRSDGGAVLTGRALLFQSMADEFEAYLVVSNEVPVFDSTTADTQAVGDGASGVCCKKSELLAVD